MIVSNETRPHVAYFHYQLMNSGLFFLDYLQSDVFRLVALLRVLLFVVDVYDPTMSFVDIFDQDDHYDDFDDFHLVQPANHLAYPICFLESVY